MDITIETIWFVSSKESTTVRNPTIFLFCHNPVLNFVMHNALCVGPIKSRAGT